VHELLEDLMDAASGRGDYADVRHVAQERERLVVRNGSLETVERERDEGFGVRVRLGGAWGFAAVHGQDRVAAERALARAVAVAEAQPRVPGAAALAPESPARGEYVSPVRTDPFEVSLEDKVEVLVAAERGLRAEPVSVSTAWLTAFRTDTAFASTDGAAYTQRTTECGGGMSCVAVGERGTQVRSYPAAHEGSVRQAGYEHFLTLDLPGEAARVAHEAVALLSAPACPAELTTLVLGGEQLALQVHESVGHATELDRVLGRELSYAGGSFVGPDAIGRQRIGSKVMDVTADATLPGALGSFRWDDEGVAAQAVPIVRAGVVSGFLSSRETATEIGEPRSGGCMRAAGFARQPLVRMTNVSLDPGAGSFDELIGGIDRGIYMDTNRSWSIDSSRLGFQFEAEAAWEIRDGRLGRLLRNPSYGGVTPEFWESLEAVCGPEEWDTWSVLACGKGEPGQAAHVSHGCAPARFRGVQVGVA
jgi:TldD protein